MITYTNVEIVTKSADYEIAVEPPLSDNPKNVKPRRSLTRA